MSIPLEHDGSCVAHGSNNLDDELLSWSDTRAGRRVSYEASLSSGAQYAHGCNEEG